MPAETCAISEVRVTHLRLGERMSSSLSANATYWNEFYSKNQDARLAVPSQFAAFVLPGALASGIGQVIDFGCGNGRDAIFFGRYGVPTLGLDASSNAVDEARRLAADLRVGVSAVDFVVRDRLEFDDVFTQSMLQEDLATLLYSRFVLHSIDDSQQSDLISSVSKARSVRQVCLEYRTLNDKLLPKEMPHHQRRFVDPTSTAEQFLKAGFRLGYQSIGTGFAVWGTEDAHVARQVFVRVVS